jgi:hypothetical protein
MMQVQSLPRQPQQRSTVIKLSTPVGVLPTLLAGPTPVPKGAKSAKVPGAKPKRRTYDCYLCGKTFSSSSNVARHVRIHTNEKPYECSHCSMAFSNSSNRRKHEKSCGRKLDDARRRGCNLPKLASARADSVQSPVVVVTNGPASGDDNCDDGSSSSSSSSGSSSCSGSESKQRRNTKKKPTPKSDDELSTENDEEEEDDDDENVNDEDGIDGDVDDAAADETKHVRKSSEKKEEAPSADPVKTEQS